MLVHRLALLPSRRTASLRSTPSSPPRLFAAALRMNGKQLGRLLLRRCLQPGPSEGTRQPPGLVDWTRHGSAEPPRRANFHKQPARSNVGTKEEFGMGLSPLHASDRAYNWSRGGFSLAQIGGRGCVASGNGNRNLIRQDNGSYASSPSIHVDLAILSWKKIASGRGEERDVLRARRQP